jgi:2-keto-4-pentenoate hydratase/2-oxohepta-3-ene-1,7-dioic acid hydratase in catechol pathway
MRLAAIHIDGDDAWAIGVVDEGALTVRVAPAALGTVDDVVRGSVGVDEIAHAVTRIAPQLLAEVRIGAPLRRFPRDLLCTGWNYRDHFYESAGKREGQDPGAMPAHPTFFTKGPDSVIGPYDPIAFDPAISKRWDYEAEIAVVIGTDGRSIPEERAADHIFGYLIANDVSQRDLQRAHGGQWLKGKSIDATTPLGPWITTPDDLGDLAALRITCEVNGELRQDATMGEMAFSVSRIIAELSFGMTLRAGDVILTGTPSGIGNAREPAIFLAEHDQVVTRVSGLGELRNTVERAPLAAPSAL